MYAAQTRNRFVFLTAAMLAAALFPCGSSAAAQSSPTPRDLKAVERELDRQKAERQRLDREAAAARRELTAISEKMVATARRIQDHEEALSALEDRLARLKTEDAAIRATLLRRDEQSIRVLTAIQRLALRPSEALIAQDASPADTVRAAMLLRQTIPHIRKNADELTAQLSALGHLDTAIRAQRAQIRATSDTIRAEHASLRAMTSDKQTLAEDLQKQSRDAQARMVQLTKEAQDLRDLLSRLDAEKARQAEEKRRMAEATRKTTPSTAPASVQSASAATSAPRSTPAAPSSPSFERARGDMPFPARGRVLARYGEKTSSGETVKGLRFETRAGAQVVAPHTGTVAFAGPFRGYGNLLIIDHGEGYHALLAGLGRIDAVVGQPLTAGEPVGIMPTGGASGAPPILYMELRRKGQPINPLPWLSPSKGSARG